MLEFYLLMIIILIAILTLLMNYYNRQQADALNEAAQAAVDWLMLDIRRNREKKKQEIQISEPLEWFAKYANCSNLILKRQFVSIPALEFSVDDGFLVISPLKPRHLHHALRQLHNTNKLSKVLKKNAVPLIRFTLFGRPKAATVSWGLQENEWFDIEAKLALEKLGISWSGRIDRLWFYHIQTDRR